MSKVKLITLAVAVLLSFSISCNVLINVSSNLSANLDSIDYGIVQVSKASTQTIELKNNGEKEIILTAIKIVYTNGSLNDDLQITEGEITSDIELLKDYIHTIDLTFVPTIEGLISAELIVEYTSGSKNKTMSIPVTGEGAYAKISINPAYYDFKHTYLNEPKTQTFVIRNLVVDPVTINQVTLLQYGSSTSKNELYISGGWNDTRKVLQFAEAMNIEITFNPKTQTEKHAVLMIIVEDSILEYKVEINGWGSEVLKIITPTQVKEGVRSNSYSYTIEAVGGDGNYKFEVVGGALPDGIDLLKTGELTGKSNDYGDFTFDIQVTDGSGNKAVKNFLMRVTYASLIRDSQDNDPAYIFSDGDDEGLYDVNLINAGIHPLSITKISLAGDGAASGEASILNQPGLPANMKPNDTVNIAIHVESKLDTGREMQLIVEHSGYNSPYTASFRWGVEGVQHIFIIDASGSMNTKHNVSYPVYNQDGNAILDPTRWEVAVFDISLVLRKVSETDKFEVIIFDDNLHYCFGKMEYANGSHRYDAITWLFSYPVGGCSNMYDGMHNGFNNYGILEDMYVYSDGGANTAKLLGCAGCACASWIGTRTYTDCQTWVPAMTAQNSGFHLYMLQYAASATSFMQQIGNLANCSYTLK